jgi:hypothetical protein
MWSGMIIIKSITQKVMANYGLIRRFHDLKFCEVEFLFLIFFDFIVNLRQHHKKL